MKLRVLLLAGSLCLAAALPAQVRLNEVVSSNITLEDEDGDTPDWLELHNRGAALNLEGYTLTDDADEPGKWTFPATALGADEYLLLWASDKDRSSDVSYRTLVRRGDAGRYLIPSGPVNDAWNTPGFDDRNWPTGPSGYGYNDGDDATEVPTGTRSVFVRHAFTLTDPAAVRQLLLDVDYDDGFIAYLNGRELIRENLDGERPAWDQFATTDHEARGVNGDPPSRYVIDNLDGLLRTGENVLSLQVHNVTATSSDLSIFAYLTALIEGPTTAGTEPPAVLGLTQPTLHTNFKISSRGETLYLYDPSGSLVDSLGAYNLPSGVSTGLLPGTDERVYFAEPTPGRVNDTEARGDVVNAEVIFSHPGGPVENLQLTLSGAPAGATIRYTLDATIPTENSTEYTGPLNVNRITVVRARIFAPDAIPSPIATETYLPNARHDLDVVTLVTEPDNFFDGQDGIYVLGDGYQGDFPFFGSNIWQDKEVPLHFGFYPTGTDEEAFTANVGTKIFGNFSRAQDQRSLALFARRRYGMRDLDYAFFPDRPYDEYKHLVLRNSGNDWMRSHLRDALLTGLMAGSGVDVQAYRPVVAYLNGEYWGIYNLREKVNEDFLASRHGVDPESIDILENAGGVVEGSNVDYRALMDFVEARNLRNPGDFSYVADRIDLDNFIRYYVAQIYYDNRDWPGNNAKYWRSPELDNKWRYILFDTDFGAAIWNNNAANSNTLAFALEENGPGWPNPPWSTLLLRRLTDNLLFRRQFINQFADEMNSRFLNARVQDTLALYSGRIASEMPRASRRWDTNRDWQGDLDRLRIFFRDRPAAMRRFLRQEFGLPRQHSVRVQNPTPERGYVDLNSLTLEDSDWSGIYFETVPIQLTAVARPGYRFSHWEEGSGSSDTTLTVDMTRNTTFRAIFVEASTSVWNPGDRNGLRTISDVRLLPNPSAGPLTLAFATSRRTRVRAELFDAGGRPVTTLVDRDMGAGAHQLETDVRNLPAGTYTLRITESGGRSASGVWVKQ